jgi:predicted nucleic-acid-binding Zn-ribbon protein
MHQGPQMNPYAPPTPHSGPLGGPPGSPEEAVARGVCPKCGSHDTHQPSFTWWGGMLGPKLFNHRVCRACGFGYNAATGQNNRGKIITYVVIANVIGIGAIIALNC